MTEQVGEIRIALKRGKERPQLDIQVNIDADINAKELAVLLIGVEKVKEALVEMLKSKEND